MAKYVILHDRRLRGGIPKRPGVAIINVDGGTPLTHALRSIQREAVHARISTLFIVCHGYAGANKALQVSMDAGGMGLQLGKEGVRHANVAMWQAIKGKARNIVVMACAAADTQPGNEFTAADGRYLMGALAIKTGADVFAADKIQWYYTYKNLAHGKVDFGAWEGQLYHFYPLGGQSEPVDHPPAELAEVIGHVT